MYCGAPVKVQLQAKAVIVNFVGRPHQFSALGAALRARVQAEISRAGLSAQLSRILIGSSRKTRSK